jgi:hypothetical protein
MKQELRNSGKRGQNISRGDEETRRNNIYPSIFHSLSASLRLCGKNSFVR